MVIMMSDQRNNLDAGPTESLKLTGRVQRGYEPGQYYIEIDNHILKIKTTDFP